jgi:hypothetical protein
MCIYLMGIKKANHNYPDKGLSVPVHFEWVRENLSPELCALLVVQRPLTVALCFSFLY